MARQASNGYKFTTTRPSDADINGPKIRLKQAVEEKKKQKKKNQVMEKKWKTDDQLKAEEDAVLEAEMEAEKRAKEMKEEE
jgi:hypothetical protein